MQETVQVAAPRDPSRPARPRRLPKREKSGTVYVLAFFLPFFVFTLILILQGVYPFGDNQILQFDGWHQYFPFLMKFWDHVHQGQSLLYDRSMGMGTNFLSLLSYYGASPTNLLLLLSPTRDFRVAYTLLTAIRVGLAGLFTARFLTELFPSRRTLAPAFFGLGYALSGFVVGYFWNTMWLECVALFPLLCWCTVRMLRRSKCALYVLALGLTLFSSYYIGYMCCLFTVLAFFALCFVDRVGVRGFFRRLGRFALTSLLGGGLASVILLPAFYGLLNTTSTTGAFPRRLYFYESLRDLLAPLADFHDPTVLESGLPNLYCGALVAMFAFAFLWAKKVGFREKLCGFLIAAFLLLSMNLSVLDYVWHGFHYPNMIPARFAFLFAFALVVMGYGYFRRGLAALDGLDAVGMFLFIGLAAWCAWGLYGNVSVIGTTAILGVTVVVCALGAARFVPRKAVSAIVCVLILGETAVSAWIGVQTVGSTRYSTYFNYKGIVSGEDVNTMVALVKEWEKDSTDFYRMEGTDWYSLNDSCLYGYNGVTQFASSANVRVTGFLQDLGLPADRGSNRFAYVHSTPLVNTLLGVKYLYHAGALLTDRELVCLDTPVENRWASLYENTGFAGLGFGTETSAADFAFDLRAEPYERQNALFRALTGLEGDLLIPLETTALESDTLNVTGDDGVWNYTKRTEDRDATLKLSVTPDRDGTVFVYVNVPDATGARVNNGDTHSLDQYPGFFSAGSFREGKDFVLSVFVRGLAKDDSDFGTVRAVALDSALWQAGLERLRREPMVISSYTETAMEATVAMKEDGYLYTSIPVEREGWTLTVDGEKAEITPFAGTFLGVKLSAGEHTLSFRYTPQGFAAGAIISTVSLLLLIALFVMEKRGAALLRERERPRPALSLYVDEKDRWEE